MVAISECLAFQRGVVPLLQQLLLDRAQLVIDFQVEPSLQSRIEELADKSTEGELSEEERGEYIGYVRANKFVSILKLQAERRLQVGM